MIDQEMKENGGWMDDLCKCEKTDERCFDR
jgi:hypothetical protein